MIFNSNVTVVDQHQKLFKIVIPPSPSGIYHKVAFFTDSSLDNDFSIISFEPAPDADSLDMFKKSNFKLKDVTPNSYTYSLDFETTTPMTVYIIAQSVVGTVGYT